MSTRHCIALSVVIGLLVACSNGDPPVRVADSPPSAAPSTDGQRTAVTIGSEPYRPAIDPARFTARIDNPYFPLEPGTRWVYDGGKERDTVEVTRETKVVMGVTCVVVHDVVTEGSKVIEDTYDWYAQDVDGNVWYFGEDTTSFESGKPNKEGSWEAGVDGAQPGIVMPGQPIVGDRYRQEFYRGEAEDMGEVLSLDEEAQVPFGSYTGLLKTKDTTPLEPKIVEHKYYARGIGFVLEVLVSGGDGRVELIEMTRQ